MLSFFLLLFHDETRQIQKCVLVFLWSFEKREREKVQKCGGLLLLSLEKERERGYRHVEGERESKENTKTWRAFAVVV